MELAESIVGYRDLTSLQVQAVHDTLRDLLDSPQFSKSKRYPALIEFAVRNTLEGRFDLLKERVIGTEVFGRPPEYDTTIDPVVRIAAVEVRKRLESYFTENPNTPVRFDLPLGSYRAVFHFRSQASDVNVPLIQPPPALSLQPHPETPAQLNPPEPQTSHTRLVWYGLAAFLVLLLAIATYYAWHSRQLQPNRDLWSGIAHADAPTAIVIGKGRDSAIEAALGLPAKPSDSAAGNNDPNNQLPIDSAIAVAQICSNLRKDASTCRIFVAPSTSFEEVRNLPLILVGAYDNVWTQRVLAPLRFQFRFEHSPPPSQTVIRSIVDKDNPNQPSPWSRTLPGQPTSDPSAEYAILARLRSDLTDSNVIVIAGLGPLGTRGASDFANAPEHMSEILAQAPKDWKGFNFEVVLKIDIIQRKPGHVKIVAGQYW